MCRVCVCVHVCACACTCVQACAHVYVFHLNQAVVNHASWHFSYYPAAQWSPHSSSCCSHFLECGFSPGPEPSRAREPLISTDTVAFQARRNYRWPLILIRLESSARGQGSERETLPGRLFVPTRNPLTLKRLSLSSLKTEITQLTLFLVNLDSNWSIYGLYL